eukprot:scaffold9088_cov118-Isochrysis_galbana.AAC.1
MILLLRDVFSRVYASASAGRVPCRRFVMCRHIVAARAREERTAALLQCAGVMCVLGGVCRRECGVCVLWPSGRAHFGADRDVGRPGWALGATLGSEISPGIVPRLPQPVLRAQSPSLARSTAQCDAVSPLAQASARQDQAEVSVAPRAAVAQCAVTSPRQVCPAIAPPDGSLPESQSVACGHSRSRRRCRAANSKKNSVWGYCASRTPGFLSGGSVYVSKRTLADPQIGHQSKW